MKTLWMLDRTSDLYAPKRLKLLCEARSFDFRFFLAGDLPPPSNRSSDAPTAIFVCLRDPEPFAPALRAWQDRGVKVLNQLEAISLAADKFASNQKMAAAQIPVPRSLLLQRTTSFQEVADVLGFPMVIKGFPSGQGKHVRQVYNLEGLINCFEDLSSQCKGVMAQAFVADSFGRDLRVLTLMDKVIGVGLRTAPPGVFAANVSTGASLEQFPLTPTIESLALKAAQLHGLQFSGVDLLFGPSGDFQVCEINSAPAFFPPFEDVFGLDIGAKLLDVLMN